MIKSVWDFLFFYKQINMHKQICFCGYKILSKQLVKDTFIPKVVYFPLTQQCYRIQNLIVKLPKIIKEEVNFKLWM